MDTERNVCVFCSLLALFRFIYLLNLRIHSGFKSTVTPIERNLRRQTADRQLATTR